MIVEVTGVSTRNKGAELMLLAIGQHYAQCDGDVVLAVAPWFGTYEDRIRYGLRTKLVASKFGRSSLAVRWLSANFRRAYGLVTEQDIDAVLDASGFAFGDQLGPKRSEDFAKDVERWKRQGKKVILLPQALGPFETPRIRRAFADVVSRVDLVYARDRESHAHCQRLGSERGNLRMAPDFTCLVDGALPPAFEPPPRMVCIVPNDRMLEKMNAEESAGYLPLLVRCVASLRHCGMRPCILLHDVGVDESLVAPLQRAVGESLPVIRAADPTSLKGILGCARLVVGSRFHALAGALAQAVPCLGVGWSHKYEMLFEDYDCADCLIPVMATDDQLQRAMSAITLEPQRSELIVRLQRSCIRHQQRTREMWSEVDHVLGVSVIHGDPRKK